MNTLIKRLVESRFDFNIDIEDNKDLDKLSKLKYKSISLKRLKLLVDIINAFNNHDLSILDSDQKKYLYDNFEEFRLYQYKVKDNDELEEIVGHSWIYDDLNWIDVSNVTDMTYVFAHSKFKGDISRWDISNVTVMDNMFRESEFNGDISLWDVSNVTNMYEMFAYSQFTGDISLWDVSNVKTMANMFWGSPFNGDISLWDVSNVKNMIGMFRNSQFNRDISRWNINLYCKFKNTFYNCPIKEKYKPKF